MKHKFSGTGVAIVTPFRKDGSVDFNALIKLTKHLLNGKINYIVILGTTGETVTLNKDEKQAVINIIKDVVKGKIPLVIGIGGNNTKEVVNNIKVQDFTGISGLLSVSPYYNKPNQKGLYLHYKNIAAACPVDVILYNVPGRTGGNISAETVIKLANDVENIVAVKEASANFDQVMEIIKNKPDDFAVISGDDALTLPLISIGMSGVISVVANAYPFEMSEIVNHSLKGNLKKAREYHYKLIDFTNCIFSEGNPAGVKAALEIKGIIENNLRLPLTKISKSTYNKLSDIVANIK
jgi:4-hydroxy-tetrahydrodipicolinate synthase